MGVKGYIMQAQPYSVNDGEGIRTTVFLAGCPMHCKWCSNPEGMLKREIVGWYQRKCMGCGECQRACPQHIDINMNLEREKCTACGKCVEVCPRKARTKLVSFADADEYIAKCDRHAIYYLHTGGGITFSGGEATAQPELLDYLTEKLYNRGYDLALETCGLFDFEKVKPSLDRMNMIFMDLKHMDEEKHKYWTGVSNRKTLENIKNLNKVSADVVIRIPTIGGVNADEENIRAAARYVHENLPKARMELLAYHKFGTMKYEAIGLESPYTDIFTRPSDEEMDHLRDVLREEGVEVADYR